MKYTLRLLVCIVLIAAIDSRFSSRAAAPPKPSPAKPAAHTKHKAPAKKPTGKKTTAPQLLAAAKKANAAMIKNARADKGLDPKIAKNKPFYKATQKVTKALDKAEKGLKAKNNDFFSGVSDARAAQEEMKIAWQVTDSKNKKVAEDAKVLGNALDLLRRDYSREAARRKKGGELTPKEKANFAKIQAKQKELQAKISKLQGKAKKDKQLTKGLAKMQKASKRISKAKPNVKDYTTTLYLLDDLQGQVYGYDYYVDPAWRTDWIDPVSYDDYYTPIYDDVAAEEYRLGRHQRSDRSLRRRRHRCGRKPFR